LSWVGLLRGCAAFEAYCKRRPRRFGRCGVAEFLLLNPELPHSGALFGGPHERRAARDWRPDRTERKNCRRRIAGRLRAKLSFSQMKEIMEGEWRRFLESVRVECAEIHAAIHQIYFDYRSMPNLRHRLLRTRLGRDWY